MKIALSVFIAILFLMPAGIFAQEPGGEVLKQLEKKETAPKPEEPEKAPLIEKEKVEDKVKGEIKGEQKILVKGFKIQGATILDEASLDAIIAPYQNKELTLAQINQAADKITAAYRVKGYLTANAFVPAQDIKDGIVVIQITEGKTGIITVTGNQNYTTGFIQGHIEKVRQDPSLKEQTLERALLILNDYPSLNVNASLKAGTEPGTTDIAIKAADSYPISASLSYDNYGTRTLSKSRATLFIDKGSTITDGDSIKLTGVTGLDRIDLNKLSYGRFDYTAPIDYNGTKIGVYYANSLYEAGRDLTPLIIKGKAHIAGIYITNPIIKTTDAILNIKLGFDYKDVYDYILYTQRSEDNIRTANIGLNYDTVDNLFNLSGRNIIGINYYQGIRDIFGGTGKNDINTSRYQADGQFGKYTLDAARIQRLSKYDYIIIKGAGQFSKDALFIAEQFSIGGAGSVRGYNPSSQSGDSGYNITAELQFSPILSEQAIGSQKLGDTIKFALFTDHGGVFRNKRQPGENKDDYLTSIGAGLMLFYTKNFSARLDYAVPYRNGELNGKNSKIYLKAVVGF